MAPSGGAPECSHPSLPMAALIKQRGSYYLDFNDKMRRPARRRIPLGVRNGRDAARVRAKLERDYALGRFDPWTDDPLAYDRVVVRPEQLGEALDAFLDSRRHKAARTVEEYRKTLGRFVLFVGADAAVSSLTAADVERWFDSTKAGDVTRKSYAERLRAFARWAVAERIAATVFTDGVRLRRVPSKFPRFLSDDEVDAVVAVARVGGGRAWMADIILFAVHTGLRRAEISNLQWNAVDLPGRVLTVANTETFTTKSGAERRVPLSDTAVAVLERCIHARPAALRRTKETGYVFICSAGGQVTPDNLSHTFKRFARAAGVPDVHFHHLRHTACSRLAQKGVPVEVIRRFAGHSTTAVTERYCHVGQDFYAAAILHALA